VKNINRTEPKKENIPKRGNILKKGCLKFLVDRELVFEIFYW